MTEKTRTSSHLSLLAIMLLLAVAAAVFLYHSSHSTQDFWFGDLENPLELSTREARQLVAYAANSLNLQGPKAVVPENMTQDRSPRIVLLSIITTPHSPRLVFGSGRGIIAALDNALFKARRLRKKDDFAIDAFKLDFVREVFSGKDLRALSSSKHNKGVYGIALQKEGPVIILGEELLSNGLLQDNGLIDAKRAEESFKKQGKDVSIRQIKEPMFGFTTLSYYWDGNIKRTYRGNTLRKKLPPKQLLEAAKLGGAYLTRALDADGKFEYSYDPITDSPNKGYNILRHAGAVYSMLELYQVTKDEDLLRAAERAIGYLLKQTTQCRVPSSNKTASCIIEKDAVKLGGNALAIVALTKHMEVTGTAENRALTFKLASWITSTQLPDGRFGVHKLKFSKNTVSDFISEYYPGEAILALMRLYAVEPRPEWLDAAARAADYLIEVRDKNVPKNKLPHDHWLLYGLNELYGQHPESRYLEHTRKIAMAIMGAQISRSVYPDWLGGYYIPPRSTPTATRAEGLAAAYYLFREFDNMKFADHLASKLKKAVHFQLRTQFVSESVLYLTNPQHALGGFRSSLEDFEIRIDYVQHNISSLLALRKILLEQEQKYGSRKPCSKYVNRKLLNKSIELGTHFMLENQKSGGNFVYEYDWISKKETSNDRSVRQAGALWGVTLLNQYHPDKALADASEKSFSYFRKYSELTPEGDRYLVYPFKGESHGLTGAVAVLALAYIDYLRTIDQNSTSPLRKELGEYLRFLRSTVQDDFRVHGKYDLKTGKPYGEPSPYFTGETLLAFIKAAKYLGFEEYKQLAASVADAGIKTFIEDALKADPDSDLTKGFYQWSSMSFYELATSGWPETEKYEQYVIDLADWMIDVHKTLKRRRNTGYAYEGIIHAYLIAQSRGDTQHMEKFQCTAEQALEKLISWQVGSPISDDFIQSQFDGDKKALGGVQNGLRDPALRIDVTQHQLHALLLAESHLNLK